MTAILDDKRAAADRTGTEAAMLQRVRDSATTAAGHADALRAYVAKCADSPRCGDFRHALERATPTWPSRRGAG